VYAHAFGQDPEIFQEGCFETFLYGNKNLGGVLGSSFENPSKLENLIIEGDVLTPKTPPWVRPYFSVRLHPCNIFLLT